MNIVLIGMRGVGKTAVGRLLADELGRSFVDMDDLIVKRAGMSINDIVSRHGWSYFRELEEKVTAEVTGGPEKVVAAGGGVVTNRQNIQALKKRGIMIWLRARADTLLARIGGDTGRPQLIPGRSWREDIEVTLAEREPLYDAAADITIDTEGDSPDGVVKTVIRFLKARGVISD
jgi:shikimate kinase